MTFNHYSGGFFPITTPTLSANNDLIITEAQLMISNGLQRGFHPVNIERMINEEIILHSYGMGNGCGPILLQYCLRMLYNLRDAGYLAGLPSFYEWQMIQRDTVQLAMWKGMVQRRFTDEAAFARVALDGGLGIGTGGNLDRGIEASLRDPRGDLFDGSGRTYQSTPSSRCETVVSFADEAQAIANGSRRGRNSSSTFREDKHTRRIIDDRQDRCCAQRRHSRGSRSQAFSPVSSSAADKPLRIESASQVDRNHQSSSYPRDHQTRYSSFLRDQQPQGYRKSDAIGNSDTPRSLSKDKAYTSGSSIDETRKYHSIYRDDSPYRSISNSDASIRPDDSVSVRGDRFDMRAMDRDLPLLGTPPKSGSRVKSKSERRVGGKQKKNGKLSKLRDLFESRYKGSDMDSKDPRAGWDWEAGYA